LQGVLSKSFIGTSKHLATANRHFGHAGQSMCLSFS
jgi:hypothetical protein